MRLTVVYFLLLFPFPLARGLAEGSTDQSPLPGMKPACSRFRSTSTEILSRSRNRCCWISEVQNCDYFAFLSISWESSPLRLEWNYVGLGVILYLYLNRNMSLLLSLDRPAFAFPRWRDLLPYRAKNPTIWFGWLAQLLIGKSFVYNGLW
jgi:hypothetical protein